ncbi:MAG: RNA polymerase sigma factor [Nannocystaceae bacterium]
MNVRDTLFRLAYLATADPNLAASHVHDVMSSCDADPQDIGAHVAILADKYAEELQDYPRAGDWAEWDATLRTSVTTADQLDDATRKKLAWELKRVCLSRALGSLRPVLRVAFVFVDIHGMDPKTATKLLRLGPSTLNTRLVRARRALADALESTCQHLGRGNPCQCAGRVGIALRAGLISEHPTLPTPPGSHAGQPVDDVRDLYRRLPVVSSP